MYTEHVQYANKLYLIELTSAVRHKITPAHAILAPLDSEHLKVSAPLVGKSAKYSIAYFALSLHLLLRQRDIEMPYVLTQKLNKHLKTAPVSEAPYHYPIPFNKGGYRKPQIHQVRLILIPQCLRKLNYGLCGPAPSNVHTVLLKNVILHSCSLRVLK